MKSLTPIRAISNAPVSVDALSAAERAEYDAWSRAYDRSFDLAGDADGCATEALGAVFLREDRVIPSDIMANGSKEAMA